MSDVMNKTTFQVLRSVHTPDYPKEEWWNNFDNPVPKLQTGFDYNPRNWKTVDNKIVATTEEEKAKWDAAHPTPEPTPTIEERLSAVEQELAEVKNSLSVAK